MTKILMISPHSPFRSPRSPPRPTSRPRKRRPPRQEVTLKAKWSTPSATSPRSEGRRAQGMPRGCLEKAPRRSSPTTQLYLLIAEHGQENCSTTPRPRPEIRSQSRHRDEQAACRRSALTESNSASHMGSAPNPRRGSAPGPWLRLPTPAVRAPRPVGLPAPRASRSDRHVQSRGEFLDLLAKRMPSERWVISPFITPLPVRRRRLADATVTAQ